jgi:hypothetical protein
MRWAVLLVVAGCGRLEFDSRLDASSGGHDEDGDGIPDATDPCPHVAGDTADGDGDGVGDACDPNPGTPGDHFGVFATLQPGDSPFRSLDGFTQEDDGIRHGDASEGTLHYDHAVANVTFEVGFDIRAVLGNAQHQIASGIVGSTPYYFVELNEDGPQRRHVAVIAFDGTSGYQDLGATMHNGVHTGVGMLRYQARISPDPQQSIVAGWTDELYDASAMTPAYTGGDITRITLNGVDVLLTYFVAIESP